MGKWKGLGCHALDSKTLHGLQCRKCQKEFNAYKSDLKVIILGVGPLGLPLIPFISVTHLL
jgi:hypothetical protein